MNYVHQAAGMLPFAAIAAFIFYILFALVHRARGHRFPWTRHLLHYIFLGYCFMVVLITFLWYSFPGSMGNMANLTPFRTLYDMYNFGNTSILVQYILNIVLFVPFGFLLPIVFPKRLRNPLRLISIVLLIPVVIELVQLFIGRVADIDDVIMNISGGLCGYAIYILGCWVVRKRRERIIIRVASVLVIVLTVSIPLTVYTIVERREFGIVAPMYMQLPEDLDVMVKLSAEKGYSMAYKQMEVDRVAIMEQLQSVFHVSEEARLSSDGYAYFAQNESLYMNVFEDGRWSANLRFSTGEYKDIIAPDDHECIDLALEIMEHFRQDGEELVDIQVMENMAEYQVNDADGSVRWEKYINGKTVVLTSVSAQSNIRIQGDFVVLIGEKGVITNISNHRRFYQALREIPVLSQRTALERAKKGGYVQHDLVEMTLTMAEMEYLDDRKGHLLPVYKFSGIGTTKAGEQADWSTYISAMQ